MRVQLPQAVWRTYNIFIDHNESARIKLVQNNFWYICIVYCVNKQRIDSSPQGTTRSFIHFFLPISHNPVAAIAPNKRVQPLKYSSFKELHK